jgi:hypothetical protein
MHTFDWLISNIQFKPTFEIIFSVDNWISNPFVTFETFVSYGFGRNRFKSKFKQTLICSNILVLV